MTGMTPAAWLQLLEPKLNDQARRVRLYRDYYAGHHRLAFATQKFLEAFARFFPPMANNWMQIVVDAAVERLEVQGFRLGAADPGVPSWDQQADETAWEIWQANDLDAGSVMAHTEAVKCGKAYTLTWPSMDGGLPLISIEHPSQVFVLTASENRRIRLAAIKRWVDEDGYAYANIYLPAQIHKWRSKEKLRSSTTTSDIQWVQQLDESGENPLGVVPIVPLENNPDLLLGGRSDLDVAMPIQDAVNKLCLDMQVSSEFHAYPQRTATGWELPRDSKGNIDKSAALRASQSTVWASEDVDTKFGQLTPGDVQNYIQPIEMYIDHLAALTRTPAYYLKGKMANLSADALRAAETGLVARVKRKIIDLGDGWEETMRLAFLASGDKKRGMAMQAETLWADPEAKSIGAVVDAAVKMRESLSLPLEMCWQMLGFTPQQIKQARDFMNLPATPPSGATPNPSNGSTSSSVIPAGAKTS